MDLKKLREDFPFFQANAARGKSVAYLDNACQTLRPQPVLDAMSQYYLHRSACSGRSMHRLGDMVTRDCEEARATIAKFVGAARKEEIVFTRNTTEGINLVAHSLALDPGDVVLVSDKEHNSNLLPWQKLAKQKGITIRVIPSEADNTFSLEALGKLLDPKVRLVALAYTHNLDGVTIPAREVVRMAHQNGTPVLLDAAQTAPHRKLDLRALDADFLAFSGHKMLGPSGTGVLYGKYQRLEQLEPFLVGGGTVAWSSYDSCEFLPPPERFEAGLQDYAGIVGLAAAVRYLEGIGLEEVERHERHLNGLMTEQLKGVPRVKLIGPADPGSRGGICSFYLEGVDSHRVALMLDQMAGVMVRSGQHCVHSWFGAHDIAGSVRASVYLYNTVEEVELLTANLQKIARVL